MSPKRVILQPGATDPTNLFVYAHIDPNAIKEHVAETTKDCAVVEFWGEGTSAYKPVLPFFGGTWASYVDSVQKAIGKKLIRTTLTTWSAGSQLAKSVCAAGGTRLPDAIVMMDGLYGAKPPGTKAGDGKVVMDAELLALAQYALEAAKGNRIFVLFHSKIPTPYASSKECAEAVMAYVENQTGQSMTPDTLTPADLDKHAFDLALVLGNFHCVEFPGFDAKEHVTEAHLYDEAWRKWIPWLNEEAPAPVPMPRDDSLKGLSIAQAALQISLDEEAAHVGENPPGSNKVKPEYWAGCTRLVNGAELLVKINVGPWCAASFQWASYEAARRLGYNAHDVMDWLSGPVPHGRRISVIEIQWDMTKRGLFRSIADVRASKYEPQAGDACFLNRAGGTAAGLGHITRYVRRIDAQTFETVGGNEASVGQADRDDLADRWRKTVRRFDDARIRGFGAFPAIGAPAVVDTAAPPLEQAALDTVSAAFTEWLGRNDAPEEEQA